jgi:hypothetical protein
MREELVSIVDDALGEALEYNFGLQYIDGHDLADFIVDHLIHAVMKKAIDKAYQSTRP